jgi:hypothetical protein
MKLIGKTREGGKVTRNNIRSSPCTKGALPSPDISVQSKQKQKNYYAKLNSVFLKQQITKLQHKLLRLKTLKKDVLLGVNRILSPFFPTFRRQGTEGHPKVKGKETIRMTFPGKTNL